MTKACLHCTLMDAAQEWLRLNGRASPQDVVQMLGQFTAQLTHIQYPGHTALVTIAGIKFDEAENVPPGNKLH